MTPTASNLVGLWDWILSARVEDLFNFEWHTNDGDNATPLVRRREPHQRQSVPVFDWMEQQLVEGSLTGQEFEERLKTFLRVWDHFAELPEYGRAASRMLVRLLRNPGLQSSESDRVTDLLRGRLPAHPLWDPESSAPALTSAEAIGSFLQWGGGACLGCHRLLFPLYFPDAREGAPSGALMAAEVRVIERKNAPDCVRDKSFVLAPWSWFEWMDPPKGKDGKDAVAFDSVSRDLREALIRSGRIGADGPTGCQVRDRSVVFVIDLQPLSRKRDFAQGRDRDILQELAWSCGSWDFRVGGNSMGLTIAFAAWAAASGLAVRPLIATGKVERDAKIGRVGGEKDKCEAIDHFCNESGLEWCRIFPFDWSESEYINRKRTPKPEHPQDLMAAFELDLLTDGFDAYRIAIGVQGSCRNEKVLEVVEANHSLLAGAPAQPPSDGRGFIAADRAPAEEVRDRLARWLGDPQPETVPRDLPPLIVPFDEEEPEVFADWLLQELRATWPRCDEPARLGTLPVVVPVPLERMVEAREAATRTLADRLAAAIRERFQTPTPTAEQMAIVLRRPGKLVLLVYPPKSMTWWERLTTGGWDRLEDELLSLRGSGQIVVPICSDLHHRYRWIGDPNR